MVVVVHYLDSSVGEVVYRLHSRVEAQGWQLQRHAPDLLAGLVEVVEVEVTVPASPDEFTRFEVADLSHHAGQQAV